MSVDFLKADFFLLFPAADKSSAVPGALHRAALRSDSGQRQFNSCGGSRTVCPQVSSKCRESPRQRQSNGHFEPQQCEWKSQIKYQKMLVPRCCFQVEYFIPYEFTAEGYLQRINFYLNHQIFNATSRTSPYRKSLEVFISQKGETCNSRCEQEGTFFSISHILGSENFSEGSSKRHSLARF